MKDRLTKLLGIGVVLVFFAWIYWLNNVDHKSHWLGAEPRYEGQPLSYWLINMSRYGYPYGRIVNTGSKDAVLHIGTDALPWLLKWIAMPFSSGPGIQYQQHAVEGFEMLGATAGPAVPDLIKLIGDHDGCPERALVFIGSVAVPALTNKLAETLADRHEAIMNWRARGYKKNFFHVQVAIIHLLGEMGTNAEAAIPTMKQALYANHHWGWFEDQDPFSALIRMGQNHPEVVLPALIDVLTNSSAPAFNRGAIGNAMAMYGTNHADVLLPALITTINLKGTDDQNRATMARALAIIGHNQPEVVVPVLVSAFTNTDVKWQYRIAEAFGTLGSGARPVLPLLAAASQSPEFSLRLAAAIAVKTIAPERTNALASLIRDLNQSELFYRQQAINALGKLGTNGQEAVPALLQCLSHPNPITRYDAVRALSDLGVESDEFIADLAKMLSDANDSASHEACSTLIQFAPRSKVAFVALLKQGSDGQIGRDRRFDNSGVLDEISRKNPKIMLECLDDPDPLVRARALFVFLELAQFVPESLQKLRWLATNEPEEDVRRRAAQVLEMQSRQ